VLANLDLFIVNVALPNIARDLGEADLERLSWILNGYAIVYAALLVFFGRLAERYRRNAGFLLAVAVFTGASTVCAAATSLELLVATRIVRAGAALMTPASLGLLLATFPPRPTRPRRQNLDRDWRFRVGARPRGRGLSHYLELAMDLYGQRADRTVGSRDGERPRSSDPFAARASKSSTQVEHEPRPARGLALTTQSSPPHRA
jgi:hypothetical protein